MSDIPEHLELENLTPDDEWSPKAIEFTTEAGLQYFNYIITTKRNLTQNVMSDPEAPTRIRELNDGNLRVLNELHDQITATTQQPYEITFHEPNALMQALFACKYVFTAIENDVLPDKQDVPASQLRENTETIFEELCDLHWHESPEDIVDLYGIDELNKSV